MSSEFLRCNYLELIYCNKGGDQWSCITSIHPPKVSQKEWLQQKKKKQVQVLRTPTIWRGIFVFFTSYHRQPTRKMCFMLNVCPPLRHCDDGNGGSMWQCFFFRSPTVGWSTKTLRKNWCLSSHLPPFHQVVYISCFFGPGVFFFFATFFIAIPTNQKDPNSRHCRRKRWVPMRLKL